MKKIILAIILIAIGLTGYFFFTHKIADITTIPANRLTYSGDGITFQYPPTFSGNVWLTHAMTWPPIITVIAKDKDPFTLGCDLSDIAPVETGSGFNSHGLPYLSYKRQDGGAGTMYSSYCYILQGTANNYVGYFVIASHTGCEDGNCGAYCDTTFEQECRNFDMTRDIETPIADIMDSLQEISSK